MQTRIDGFLRRALTCCAVGSIGATSWAAGLGPADEFKKFVEDPPPIALFIYDQEVPEPGGNSSYFQNFFRWQTNALLFAHGYTNLFAIDRATDLSRYPDVIGSFDGRHTRRQGVAYWEWNDTGAPDESRNSLKLALDLVLNVFTANAMNMGPHHVPVRSIRWRGDEFSVTNGILGTLVKGRLLRDDKNRAAEMTLESRPLNSPRKEPERWTYRYEYLRTLPLPFLPSRITALRNKGGVDEVISHFNIYRVETTNSSMPISAFLSPEAGATTRIVVSNKFLVHIQPDGQIIRPDRAAAGEMRGATKLVYLLVALALLVPLIFLRSIRRKDAKEQ